MAGCVLGFGIYQHRQSRKDRLPAAEITRIDGVAGGRIDVGYYLRPRDGGSWIVQDAEVLSPRGPSLISVAPTEIGPEGAERVGANGIALNLPIEPGPLLRIKLIVVSKARMDRISKIAITSKLPDVIARKTEAAAK